MISILPLTLFVSAALALWLAAMIRGRGRASGVRAFAWLMTAVGLWCLTGALHGQAGTLAEKLLWAKLQVVAIASVPVFWLLFAAEYGGSTRQRRLTRVLLWPIPIVTMVMAATSEQYPALWSGASMLPSGYAGYEHGWWFWIDALYSYALVFGGSFILARSVRRSAPIFRAQILAVVAAAAIPLVANLVYLSGLSLPGLDLTPLAFTLSGMLLASSVFWNHLFDLVPVARAMVVDSLTDAMIVLDRDRRILDVNEAASLLAGSHGNLAGRRVDDMLPAFEQVRLAPVEGAPHMVMLAVDGTERRYDVRVAPVRPSRDNEAAWVVLLRDVTDQWQAAHERDILQARMQEQQRRESLSMLAAGLAHDFNNLLAGIVGNADLLALQMPPKSEMNTNVSAILLGAQRAADLVSKMLAYAGERHGSIARLDMDQLTRELLVLLRAAAARHCTIDYYGSSACIDADPTQIRQVAMNLIINATESVDESAGVVTVTTGTGRLTARQLADMTFGQEVKAGDYAYLEVRDNGHGMDAQTLRRIFMPFFTTKPSGHGLGLAAVQGIVHGHRGALRVESETGRGSRFCVWFPLAQSPAAERSGSAAMAQEAR